MTIQEAISAIVGYKTLPPQIDYRLPDRIKAIKAEDFLEDLGEEGKIALKDAAKQIADYWNSDAPYYDSLF